MAHRYHAGEGTQSKRKIQSGIDLLRQKFNKQNPAFAAAQRAREERERELENQKLLMEKQDSAPTQGEADAIEVEDRHKEMRGIAASLGASRALSEPSPIIEQNARSLLSLVSNLYIGNLNPEVSEDMLTKVFNKFGEVQSVKLMLPRNEEERRQRRNCGFVKYATYESAYLAKETLREKHLLGIGLKLVWGKGIPIVIKSRGMLEDYTGVAGDPELEMQYIEN